MVRGFTAFGTQPLYCVQNVNPTFTNRRPFLPQFTSTDYSTKLLSRVGGFKEGQEGRPPPNSPPNKFQGKTSGTSRMLENLLAVSSGPAGGAYSAPSQTPQLVGRTGCPRSRPFWASGFVPSASPLTRNRRLDPSKHDRLGPPILSRRLGPCDLGIIDDLIIYRCSKM